MQSQAFIATKKINKKMAMKQYNIITSIVVFQVF